MTQGRVQEPAGKDAGTQGDQGQVDPASVASTTEDDKDDAEIWAELEESERAAAKGDETPAAEDASREAAGDSGPDGGAAAEESADAGEVEAQKPTAKKKAAAASGEAAAQKTSKPDPWANATDEQRAAHEAAQAQIKKLEQAERSNRGRISALQRQLNSREPARQETTATGKPDASSKAKDSKASTGADDFLGSDDWKGFTKEYPEVAGPMGNVIKRLQDQLAKQQEVLGNLSTARHQDAVSDQEAALEEQHSDWRDVAAEDGFPVWLESQPRHIREAAVRNALEIVDAEEAADVIGRYKASRSELGDNPGSGSTAASPSKTGNGQTRQGSTGHSLSGKRQRQLESSSAARSTGPGAAHGIPEEGDPQAIWDAFEREERRREG